jgi:acyl carrier protein
MNTVDIEREIKAFIVDNFLFGRTDQLSDDESLLGKVIDSTGALELVGFLQERFSISVDDEDVVPENLDSVKNVVAYVEKKIKSKPEISKSS